MTSQPAEAFDDAQFMTATGALPQDALHADAVLAGDVRPEGDGWTWLPPFPHPWRQPFASLVWVGRALAGVFCLVGLLTWLGSVPGLNLLALGYLLEAQGRIARSGKLRLALPLLPVASRLGAIACGMALVLVPLRLLAEAAAAARLIAPSSTSAWLWTIALFAATALAAGHILCALACGGRLTRFVRPIANLRQVSTAFRAGIFWVNADRNLRSVFRAIGLSRLFVLGACGFVGTWIWLALPTAMFLARSAPAGVPRQAALWLGGALLVPVLGWVPLLQTRMAAEGRWQAILELRRAREVVRRVPLSYLSAIVLLYASSIPLFLYTSRFKLYAPWISAWWDLTLISVLCTLPARAMLGIAWHRAARREAAGKTAPPILVWGSRVVLVVALGFYLWLLRLTPMTHDLAPWRLVHHILVLPVP